MHPALFFVVAIFCFAIQNVVIERHLARIPAIGTMVFFYIGALALAIPVFALRGTFGTSASLPSGTQWWIVIACGALLACADFCWFTGYNRGVSLMTATTIATLLPVFASLIKAASGGGFPSVREILAYVCAAAAVALVSSR